MTALLCPFCMDHPDGEQHELATVLAPQWGDMTDRTNPRWIAICDSHWATWWQGGDHEFTPEKRLPAFDLKTMKAIPVEDHPICWDWLDDPELYSEKNRYRHPWLNVKPEDAVPGIIVKTILPPRE